MDHRIPVTMFEQYKRRGFSCLRFNFRGIGRSVGVYDNGQGELQDAAYALDWMQSFNQNAPFSWVSGYSFGAWIGMQLLMRRPEVADHLDIAMDVIDDYLDEHLDPRYSPPREPRLLGFDET